jgi:hypothetical protein
VQVVLIGHDDHFAIAGLLFDAVEQVDTGNAVPEVKINERQGMAERQLLEVFVVIRVGGYADPVDVFPEIPLNVLIQLMLQERGIKRVIVQYLDGQSPENSCIYHGFLF